MSGPNDDEVDGVQQRVVSAADSSPLYTTAASSVFNWRRGGTAADETPEPTAAPSPQPEEEKPMATAKKKGAARARKSSNGSPQLQICSVLLQNGGMNREALGVWGAEIGLSSSQISSALNNAKSHKRVACDAEGEYTVTKTGTAWVQAGTGDEGVKPEKPERKTAHRRGRKPKEQKVDTSPADEEAADATFRCAVMSDGCFFISKDGTTLELDPDEHRQMLHYLDRMVEPEVA